MTSMTDQNAAAEVTALPVPNLPLLRKVLDHIDAHPEEWDQSGYAPTVGDDCGTSFCVAGHAVAMSIGVEVVEDAVYGQYALRPADGRLWEDAAKDVLGLTEGEANSMFYGTYSEVGNGPEVRANVQRIAEGIAARAGERL